LCLLMLCGIARPLRNRRYRPSTGPDRGGEGFPRRLLALTAGSPSISSGGGNHKRGTSQSPPSYPSGCRLSSDGAAANISARCAKLIAGALSVSEQLSSPDEPAPLLAKEWLRLMSLRKKFTMQINTWGPAIVMCPLGFRSDIYQRKDCRRAACASVSAIRASSGRQIAPAGDTRRANAFLR